MAQLLEERAHPARVGRDGLDRQFTARVGFGDPSILRDLEEDRDAGPVAVPPDLAVRQGLPG